MKTIHGGDIYRNHVNLDFSVNMNPLGIPDSVKEALHGAVSKCMTYPDIHVEKLGQSVSRMIGVPEETLLFGNGASELFIAVVHALRPKHVLIPVPSFYGYEHAANAVSANVIYYNMKEENQFLPDAGMLQALDEHVDMLFLANPNNPTGVCMEKEELLTILEHCKGRQITVVLDECFIEFCEKESSVIDRISDFDNLIIIRAFTKIFTIPGVRLGYLVCQNQDLRAEIHRQLPEWNVSTFAQEAGIACTEETGFIEETLTYLKHEREFLTEGLEKLPNFPCHVYSGTANFLLLRTSKPFYQKLLEKGILVRDCSNFRGLEKGYYRIAVKKREENEKLLKAIGEIQWNE